MKLGSLRGSSRDGVLCVVRRDLSRAVRATGIADSLRQAVEEWTRARPLLEELSRKLESGSVAGEFAVDESAFHSPLPRTFQWADGSAFLYHVELVRRARGAEMPESFRLDPLMYQGGGDDFMAPTDPIPQISEDHGTDFEGEVAVVTNDVPMGVSAEKALEHIVLVLIANDISLRGLIPAELAKGFGFFQSKPSSSFAPFACTPDELGTAWRDGRVHLPLLVHYNNQPFGRADAGQMHFHFGELIAHAARTRNLAAGAIIGSGTVSNSERTAGSSCLAEKRMIEQIEKGRPETPFMRPGDCIQVEMRGMSGESLFGAINQKVVRWAGPNTP